MCHCVVFVVDASATEDASPNLQQLAEQIQALRDLMIEGFIDLSHSLEDLKSKHQCHIQQPTTKISFPKDCAEVMTNGEETDGIYTIYIPSDVAEQPASVQVYCDMTTDGGGWTVFLRRVDDKWNFPSRTWYDYTNGFGEASNSYWLGSKHIHKLTSSGSYKLRVDLEDWEGNRAYAEYSQFSVGSEDDHFRLSVSGYTGDAGDSLHWSNGNQFSTVDADHDTHTSSCAQDWTGAWWYKACMRCQLTGEYFHGPRNRKTSSGMYGFIGRVVITVIRRLK